MAPAALRHAALAIGLLLGCAEAPDPGSGTPDEPSTPPREGPPHALWDIVDLLREDVAARRHASDGSGRAWLETPDDPVRITAGRSARFPVVFEVGPHGVSSGGSIQLQVSAFWDWSAPQLHAPDRPGYTTVEPDADDAELEVQTFGELLDIRVVGRALRPGERIRITYGAGEAGAVADRYAERDERLWIAVDGDGDGIRAFLEDSPSLDVEAREPAQLHVALPSVARPGERVELVVAVLDAVGNAGVVFEGEIALDSEPDWPGLPERVALDPGDAGRTRVAAPAPPVGTYRVNASSAAGLRAEANPLVVSEAGPRVLWADLHGHSNYSDGSGLPEDYFRYARDVAGLDVVALTDHDHWGVMMLDGHPERWAEIREQTRRFHAPGRFVTLLGYEWTSWIHGHRHVLYFGDEGEIYSSIDPAYDSPQALWAALEGRPALTFAHHSAGGPIPTNWEIPPDPRFEPVTEIASVHGSSEAPDAPFPIYDPVAGNFVRDALDRGYRLGFVGSGDGHDGHPGLSQLASHTSGLAAILAEERTREAVLAALRARRTYATNGPRILLRCALGAHGMGSVLEVPEGGTQSETLFVQVVSPGPLERLDLVRSGRVVEPSLALEGLREFAVEREIEELAPGEYLYVRVVQEDGGAAWSSPFFIERAP